MQQPPRALSYYSLRQINVTVHIMCCLCISIYLDLCLKEVFFPLVVTKHLIQILTSDRLIGFCRRRGATTRGPRAADETRGKTPSPKQTLRGTNKSQKRTRDKTVYSDKMFISTGTPGSNLQVQTFIYICKKIYKTDSSGIVTLLQAYLLVKSPDHRTMTVFMTSGMTYGARSR